MSEDKDQGLATVLQQFSLQAKAFAASSSLHSDAVLAPLLELSDPQSTDVMLDVACGSGSVVAAFAPYVASAVGIDCTEAMLDQARALQRERGLANVQWRTASVYDLPYEDSQFDIVACRFAFHHFSQPEAAFAEMVRVSKARAQIVLCDAVASDDPAKADALNQMERLRDPSTVAFRTLTYLSDLFVKCGLEAPAVRHTVHHTSMSRLLANSFPADGDSSRLRQLLLSAVEGDRLGLNAHWQGDELLFEAPVAILFARRAAR